MSDPRCLVPGDGAAPLKYTHVMNSPEISDLLKVLQNIDTSLQMLANSKSGRVTTAFISKKALAARMNVPGVKIDKLIHQGITSGGTSGLVEGRHYCKLDPTENNPSNFLYDSTKVLTDAWKNFSGYGNEQVS